MIAPDISDAARENTAGDALWQNAQQDQGDEQQRRIAKYRPRGKSHRLANGAQNTKVK